MEETFPSALNKSTEFKITRETRLWIFFLVTTSAVFAIANRTNQFATYLELSCFWNLRNLCGTNDGITLLGYQPKVPSTIAIDNDAKFFEISVCAVRALRFFPKKNFSTKSC